VDASVAGGVILLVSGALFLAILVKGHFAQAADPGEYRFSVAAHHQAKLPAALNGLGLWVSLMVALTVVNYGFPIAHLLSLKHNAVPVISIGASQ
jgi:cytochrome c oxidase subunit 1